jgi:ureidoacrylate peracid hydrolase
MLTTLEQKVDPRHAALVIIDMQNDFCHRAGVTAQNGADVGPVEVVVPTLQRTIAAAKAAGTLVVYVRTTHGPWTDSEVRMEQRRGRRNPYNCVEGTWGAEWFAGLEPGPDDLVVTKHRYSAFINTNLDLILRSRGVRTVIATGTDTSVCVESTARDAFMLDYYVVFVEDCCGGADPAAHEASLRSIRRQFGVVSTSGEVLAAWQSVAAAAR